MEQELLKQISELRTEIEALKKSSTISYEVEQAFRERLALPNVAFSILKEPAVIGSTGYLSQASVQRSISISGNPESITVLEYPSGWLRAKIGTVTYQIPYFT